MNKRASYRASLRVACRVVGLASYKDVVSHTRQAEHQAMRFVYYSLCRAFWVKGVPSSQVDISLTLGRTRANSGKLAASASKTPGTAMATIAVAWHAAMRGERVKRVDMAVVVQAVREIDSELAEELNYGSATR